jgi:sugar/nucleoside kinase (ribokinase family)
VRPLAVVGNLSRDLVDGGPPRAGGAPFHAARALRVLGRPALVGAKCADGDRDSLLTPLVRLGLPVLWRGGSSTATFSFRYEGDRREMVVDALGDPWTAADLHGLERAVWVHVGALARSDFPAETLAELARNRRLSFDGQGLVRPDRTGPLELDGGYDPEVLRHVSILKLAEEEARALVDEPDEDALRSLGVAEVVVTLGSKGSLVLADGKLERVAARPVRGTIDRTGAGDAFAAAYLVSRSTGHAPGAAARRATALVAGLLGGGQR